MDTINELIYEFIADTGEEVIRELTDNELEQREIDKDKGLTLSAEIEAKTQARSSALAKLAQLGLTQEEIDAL